MTEQRYTAGDYREKNPTWHVEDSPWKASQIIKMMRRHHLRPQSVCEIGCGAGEVLRQVQMQLGGDVLCDGYEISPQAFEMSQKISAKKLFFHQVDFATAATPVYDMVLIIDVVEHIEDCFGFLRRLPGRGKNFIFHFPLDLSAQSILRGSPIMRLREAVGHVHYFTKETALALVRDCGFTVKDHFYTPTDLALPPLSVKASLARIPRWLIFALSPDLAVRLVGGFSLLILAEGIRCKAETTDCAK